jgi:hypothetical protein
LSYAAQLAAAAYRDDANKFSFSPPALGAVSEASSQVVMFAGPMRDGFSPNCNLQIQIVPDGDLERFKQLSLDQFDKLGWKVEGATSGTVSGQPAYNWHYSGEFRGKQMEWLAVVTARGDKNYLLTCTALKSRFAESRKAFEGTIRSLEVE